MYKNGYRATDRTGATDMDMHNLLLTVRVLSTTGNPGKVWKIISDTGRSGIDLEFRQKWLKPGYTRDFAWEQPLLL